MILPPIVRIGRAMVDMNNMKLHRATRSDWSEVAPQQRTVLQRWAAGSRGIITPGNLISLIGAALVVRGLYEIRHAQLIGGVAILLVGRMADVLDGLVADYTKTKSPLGEAVDASVDKILILLTLYVLLDRHLLPIAVVIVMAVHAAYSIGVSSVGRHFKIVLHPSRAGKLGATLEWLCVGLYLLGDILKQQQHSTTLALGAAVISFGLFVIAAVWSSLNYTRIVYYKRAMRS
jgi:phosphatidylglycerophosphate synthase